jgi:hypothetical protein
MAALKVMQSQPVPLRCVAGLEALNGDADSVLATVGKEKRNGCAGFPQFILDLSPK